MNRGLEIIHKIDIFFKPCCEKMGLNCQVDLTNYLPYFVLIMIIFFYILVTYYIWLPFISFNFYTTSYYVLGIILMIICIISLYKSCREDPGYVPLGYCIENGDENTNQNLKTCKICKTLKLERTHHCSKCNRCIINVDHHCVWTNNCVGAKNRKFFNLILFYGSIALIMSSISGFCVFPQIYNNFMYLETDFWEKINLYISFVITFSTGFNGVFLFGFFLKHFFNVLNDVNVIEEKFEWKVMRSNNKYKNFMKVFGKRKLFWFVPISECDNNEFLNEYKYFDKSEVSEIFKGGSKNNFYKELDKI